MNNNQAVCKNRPGYTISLNYSRIASLFLVFLLLLFVIFVIEKLIIHNCFVIKEGPNDYNLIFLRNIKNGFNVVILVQLYTQSRAFSYIFERRFMLNGQIHNLKQIKKES